MRVDVQQLRGDVVDFLGGAPFRFVPLIGTEPMQRRVRFVGAAVARDQMQCGDGNVELRFVRVLDRQELGHRAVDLERAQAEVAADAVIDVDHRRADVQFGEVADDLVGIDRTRVAAHCPTSARAPNTCVSVISANVSVSAAQSIGATVSASRAPPLRNAAKSATSVGCSPARARNSPKTSRRPADSAQNSTGTGDDATNAARRSPGWCAR